MSKPNKPGELREVTVETISLVSKAANGERFKIFKSAKPEVKEAPEEVKKDERGLFRILKEFFTGSDEKVEIKKGEVADIVSAQDKGQRLGRATDALFQVLGLNRWGENSETQEVDSEKIRSALDDFRNIASEILIGESDASILDKTDVSKYGRKISGDRLGKLKNIQSILNDVLGGLEETEDTPKEAEDVTKEEVQKVVAEAVKAVNVEEAVKKALGPIVERIEKIENARGFSNRVPEDSVVEKGANDFWEGIF